MKLHRIIISIALISLVLGACTREENSTSLNIQLPKLSTGSSKASGISGKIGALSNGGPPWDTSLNPTALTDINCYGVLVGSPEPGLNHHIANNSAGTSSVVFGPWIMAVPEGESISLDVPTGPEREITLVGFKASSVTNCVDFHGPDPTGISQPFILSQQKIDLVPGDMNITMVANFDSSKDLYDFHGPDFGNQNGGGGQQENFGDGSDGDINLTSSGIYDLSMPTGNPDSKLQNLHSHQRVTNINNSDGVTITISGGAHGYSVGDELMYIVNSAWHSSGPDYGCQNANGSDLHRGRYGFVKVVDAMTSASEFKIDQPIIDNFSTIDNVALAQNTIDRTVPFCRMQFVRVPQFNNFTIDMTSSAGETKLTTMPYNTGLGIGGVFVMKVNGTLNLVNTGSYSAIYKDFFIDMSEKGFEGGDGGASGGRGTEGMPVGGGASGSGGNGETVANDGGAGGSNNGKGGNGGTGLASGTKNDFCSGDCPPALKVFLGGGGGKGNGAATYGGKGGGVIILYARNINMNESKFYVDAAGQPGIGGSDPESGGGGGAGGSVLIKAADMIGTGGVATFEMKVNGGDGGTVAGPISATGGGGGGAGAAELQLCSMQPSGANLSSNGITSFTALSSGGTGGAGATSGGNGENSFGPFVDTGKHYSIQSQGLCNVP